VSSFDPMAAAIDWLDAYREANLSIVELYSADAVVECGCDGDLLVTSRTALIEYWRKRFAENPAGSLERVRMKDEMVLVSYAVPSGVVHAKLNYNDAGLITRCQCGPGQAALDS
jgi:SnoaL-like protein